MFGNQCCMVRTVTDAPERAYIHVTADWLRRNLRFNARLKSGSISAGSPVFACTDAEDSEDSAGSDSDDTKCLLRYSVQRAKAQEYLTVLHKILSKQQSYKWNTHGEGLDRLPKHERAVDTCLKPLRNCLSAGPHQPAAANVFRALECSRRSIKFDIGADTSFPIALMIVGVRKPVLIWRPEGEKIEKHPHEGCVFHALNVYDRVEIPKNARGLIYFVLMEVDNNLTLTCTSEESHQDRETSSSLARALTRIEKKLDKLIKLHNHDQ